MVTTSQRQSFTFDSHVQGIPCQVEVTDFISVRGSYSHNAPSDVDYHGYTDYDYTILDRKGYPAKWLERKLTALDRERIESEIFQEASNG